MEWNIWKAMVVLNSGSIADVGYGGVFSSGSMHQRPRRVEADAAARDDAINQPRVTSLDGARNQ